MWLESQGILEAASIEIVNIIMAEYTATGWLISYSEVIVWYKVFVNIFYGMLRQGKVFIYKNLIYFFNLQNCALYMHAGYFPQGRNYRLS